MAVAKPQVYATVTARGTMSLPAPIRRRFHLDQPGAQLAITVRESDGVIELRPSLPVPVDQLWYWSPDWQAKEQQADTEVATNQGPIFSTDKEFLTWLETHP